MKLSARALGTSFGLTAEEMNCVLFKLGFLDGEPGYYNPTEKALPYVIEKCFHRGPGGYPRYNRDWVATWYDESIKDALDVTPELIKEVKSELAAKRRKLWDGVKADRIRNDAEFLAKQASKADEGKAIADASEKVLLNTDGLKTVAIIGGGVLFAVGLGFVIYECVKYYKQQK